jgi:inorganic pyrophosphatase
MAHPTESNPLATLQQTHVSPWHGVNPISSNDGLTVFVENTPLSLMKYEIDLESGLLKVDHPISTSALPPFAYGFVPRTLCGTNVAQLNSRLRGDRAPLDVFVLSERSIDVAGVLADVRLVGGIPVRDDAFVDDKLVTVLAKDPSLSHVHDIADIPIHLMDRICHFLIHEPVDGSTEIGDPFDKARALRLLEAGIDDYNQKYDR